MHRPLSLLAMLATLLAGCGERGDSGIPAPSLAGPPRWRLVPEEGPAPDSTLALHVRSPLRTRFRLVGAGRMDEPGPWRELAAGQTVRVRWSSTIEPREGLDDRAPPADRSVGRTTPHAGRLQFHYADGAVSTHRVLFFSRPQRGRMATAQVLPPGRYEELPEAASIELATILATDLVAGEARLRPRDLRCLVTRPKPLGADDVIRVTRLFLEFEPLGGAERDR